MKETDVLLFCGQSNMMGESETLLEKDVVDGALEYLWLTDEAVPLCDPIGENIRFDRMPGYPLTDSQDIPNWNNYHIIGASCYGHTSLVPSFCRAYIDGTGRQVLAAHIAKGCTLLSQWLPGADNYRMLVEKAKGAIRKAEQTGKLGYVWFVWLQGESDAIVGNDKETYKKQLIHLDDSLRSEVRLTFCSVAVL
ncbi:MAG: hypothetical protein IJ518_05930 [Clostridia bacterium]|nr:hypothetical protein [Clostridia bacterium]